MNHRMHISVRPVVGKRWHDTAMLYQLPDRLPCANAYHTAELISVLVVTIPAIVIITAIVIIAVIIIWTNDICYRVQLVL